MNKDSVKENWWIVGVLIMIVGGFLVAFPILDGERQYLYKLQSEFFRNLNPNFFGFFFEGLIVLTFGFLFSIVSLDKREEELGGNGMNNTTKVRIVLIAATTIYLILIGYLLWIKAVRMPEFEWEIKALIIGSFTIFGTFNFTSENAFFIILLSFGIFVLPFVINESGILDNYPDEPPDPDVEKGYTVEEAEESLDRFIEYTNRRIDYVKKHTLSIGIPLTIIGISLLAPLYIIGSEGCYWYEWQKEIARNFPPFRTPLLLIGIPFLIIGLVLIGLYIRRHL